MSPKQTPVNKLSFDQAIGEVEEIVARLENEETDVDDLAAEVKRAVELIATCRERLHGTDQEVRQLVEKLQEQAAAGAEGAAEPGAADAPAGPPADGADTEGSSRADDLPF